MSVPAAKLPGARLAAPRLDTDRLRQFVVLAEEVNYGRAAERLHVGQPQLSRSIQRLEESLGVRLFLRTTRRTSLTPAGTLFLEEARALLAQADLAVNMVRRADAGEIGRLRIGYTTGNLFGGLFTRSLRAFRARLPKVELALENRPSAEQIKRVRDGRLDIAFHTLSADSAGLSVRMVERVRFAAMVPDDWPVARFKRLKLAQLAELPFIMSVPPEDRAAIMAACHNAGFAPRVAHEAHDVYTFFSLVAAGVGVGLQLESLGHMNVEGVRAVPLADLPPNLYLKRAIAWMPRVKSPILSTLVSIVEETAKAS